MNCKKTALLISLIFCLFIACSGVYAEDIDVNDTVNIIDERQSVSYEIYDDGELTVPETGDVLSASTVYFDASASKDGTGTKKSPYKYYKSGRIANGATAYFADGVYYFEDQIKVSAVLNDKTTIIGESSQNTIFKSNYYYAFIVNANSNLVLKDLTISETKVYNMGNFKADNVIFKNNPDYGYGIIYSVNGSSISPSIELTNCHFMDNPTSLDGGALSVFNSNVNINNCIFHNSSSEKFGGAIYSSNSNFTITNSNFDNNRAKYGGVIYSNIGDVYIYDCALDNSQAVSFGGAIASNGTSLFVEACNFTDYGSSTDAGGAIYSTEGNLVAVGSSFQNGHSYFGGAICILKTNSRILANEFINNTAVYWGGSVYTMYGDIWISGNNFISSSAGSSGGGILSRLSENLNISDNYFIQTTSKYGHAIYVDGEEGTVVEDLNTYENLYNLVCEYTGTLNGEAYSFTSNYLTFSISSGGNYLIPDIYETSQLTRSGTYLDFGISVDGQSSNVIYSPLNNNNKVKFNIKKHTTSLVNGAIEAYLVDQVGNVMYLGKSDLDNKDYSGETLETFNFKDIILVLQYGNRYDIKQEAAVSLFNYTPSVQTVIPSSYDSRDYGYITPVKNQKEGGNCWAFSGIATLEACIKKATGVTYDLSEENAKNLMAEYFLLGNNMGSNDGGNRNMFVGYLASWFGPINDELDPYDDYSSLSVLYDSIFHIQNVYYIPDRANSGDNDAIKRAIMEYGAVSVSTPWENGWHAISLVGWDDNFNGCDWFGDWTQGAWIFKNSYGTDWEENGFSYLSFNHLIERAYTFVFSDSNPYSRVYQYDFAGLTIFDDYSTDTLYYKNKFTAQGNEILCAVSTYFESALDYTLSIYKNGNLVTSQSGHSISGYNTIPLNKEIMLSSGDEFIVEMKVSTGGTGWLPLCHAKYVNKITFDKGMSFVSYNGKVWYDLHTYYRNPMVACIKAFTRTNVIRQISITVDRFSEVEVNKQVSIVVNLPKSYIYELLRYDVDGLVTIKINDKYYYARAIDGQAKLNITFDKTGTYNLMAQYRTNLETSNKVSFSFEVKDKLSNAISIVVDDVVKYYGGSKKFTATVYKNSAPLSGVDVTVSIVGDTTRILTTDSNGKITMDSNLKPGTYTVRTSYGGIQKTSKITVKSTVGTSDAKGEYSNAKVTATFLNTVGNRLANAQVTFKVASKTYTATTNSNGVATANVDLGVGNYTVTIINPNTGEQVQSKLEITKASGNFSFSTSTMGNSVTVTVNFVNAKATGQCFIQIGSDYKYVSFENGRLTSTFNNVASGNTFVYVYYLGDDNFKYYSTMKYITVENNGYSLTTPDLTAYYGGVTYTATLTNENAPLSGQSITFSVGGRSYTRTTNSNGQASVDLDLNVGDHNITVSCNGFTSNARITVKSTISASSSFSGRYSFAKVSAIFSNALGEMLVNTQVTFKVASKTYTATTNSNGVATAKVDLGVGNYTVTIINPVTGEQTQSDLEIIRASSLFKVTPTIQGNRVTLDIEFSNSLVSGQCYVNINIDSKYADIRNGKGTVTFENVSSGSRNVLVKYLGNENFNSEMTLITIDVEGAGYTLYAPNMTAYYGGVTYTVTVYDGNMPASGQTVKFKVNGNNYTRTTNSNGQASVDLELDPANYFITTECGNISVRSKIYVLPTITISTSTGVYSNSYLKARFLDSSGNGLANTRVSFKIGSTLYYANTDSNGDVSLRVDLNAGEYRVTAINPNNKYQKTFTYTVSKAAPTITYEAVQKGENITITVTISPSTSTGSIYYVYDGEIRTCGVIDGKSFLIYVGLNPGNYSLTVGYSGDNNLKSVSTDVYNTTFTVVPLKKVLTASSISLVHGQTRYMVATLKYSNGVPIANEWIDVEVWGRGYYSDDELLEFKTNSKGQIKVKCNFVPSVYDVYFYHKDVGEIHRIMTIKKATPKLIVAKKTFKVRATKKYTITLKSNLNKVLKNKKVTIKVGGVTYKAKTNYKGKATFNLKKLTRRGSFTAVVKFGDIYYKTVSKKVKITVR